MSLTVESGVAKATIYEYKVRDGLSGFDVAAKWLVAQAAPLLRADELGEKARQFAVEQAAMNREWALNALAPIGAAIGMESAANRVKVLEKHSVEELAEQLQVLYRREDSPRRYASPDELLGRVRMKTGPRNMRFESVEMLDQFSREQMSIAGDLLKLHPKVVKQNMKHGGVISLEHEKMATIPMRLDAQTGALLLVAHEIAKLDVATEGMYDNGMGFTAGFDALEKKRKVLRGLAGAIVDDRLDAQVLQTGSVEKMEQAWKLRNAKKKAALTISGLGILSVACGAAVPKPPASTVVTVEHKSDAPTSTMIPSPIQIDTPIIGATPMLGPIQISPDQAMPMIDLNFENTDNWKPVTSDFFDRDVQAVRDFALNPLLIDGHSAYVDEKGIEHFATLDEITSKDGTVTLKKIDVSDNGLVKYEGTDNQGNKIVENHLLGMRCGKNESCFVAISHNDKDFGVMYLIVVDQDTGEILRRVQTGDAGEAMAKPDAKAESIPWVSGASEYWDSVVSGPMAIQMMHGVKAINYDPGSGSMLIVDNSGKQHVILDSDIQYHPEMGGGIAVERGENGGMYYWDVGTSEWQQVEIEGNITTGYLYRVGDKYVIGTTETFEWVDDAGTSLENGQSWYTKDGVTYTWDGVNAEWVASAPETDKFLQGFDQLTTYEAMYKTTAAELMAATGAENPTFQDVAAMLNKYGNEHTTWSPGTPYVTLLEARQANGGVQVLTFDLTEPMELATDVPIKYKVMYVKGNIIPGLDTTTYDDMTLITATWPLAGGKNMSATIFTEGDVVKEQLDLLVDCVGENRQKMLMPVFSTGMSPSDVFKEDITRKAGELTVSVVLNPENGKGKNMKLKDLWKYIEARTSLIDQPATIIPFERENFDEIQELFNLAVFPVLGFEGASSFNVNE